MRCVESQDSCRSSTQLTWDFSSALPWRNTIPSHWSCHDPTPALRLRGSPLLLVIPAGVRARQPKSPWRPEAGQDRREVRAERVLLGEHLGLVAGQPATDQHVSCPFRMDLANASRRSVSRVRLAKDDLQGRRHVVVCIVHAAVCPAPRIVVEHPYLLGEIVDADRGHHHSLRYSSEDRGRRPQTRDEPSVTDTVGQVGTDHRPSRSHYPPLGRKSALTRLRHRRSRGELACVLLSAAAVDASGADVDQILDTEGRRGLDDDSGAFVVDMPCMLRV